MASVAPLTSEALPAATSALHRLGSARRRPTFAHTVPSVSLCATAYAAWESLHVSTQGKYSLERLMALHTYHQHATLLRAVVVCILTPLPALFASILLECIPLQPPSDGWRANWGFWVRGSLTFFAVVYLMATQLRMLVPDMKLTNYKCMVVGVWTTVVVISLLLGVSEAIGFPIPMVVTLSSVPGSIVGLASIFLVARIHPFRLEPVMRAQLSLVLRTVLSASVLLTVYPLYNALFLSVTPVYQSLLIVALHVLKMAAKKSVAHAASHLEDYLPEYVVMLVDFFNSLYLTACMQNARSIATMLLIIGLDLSQLASVLYGTHRRAAVLQELLVTYREANPGATDQMNFMAIALRACAQPEFLRASESTRSIKLRACAAHNVSPDYARLLGSLQASALFQPQLRRFSSRIRSQQSQLFGGAPTERLMPAPKPLVRTSQRHHSHQPRHETQLLVAQTLQTMFSAEFIALIEYVESMAPFIYVAYLAARLYLPSNVYFPSMDNDGDDTVDAPWRVLENAVLYAGLELLSFVVLNAVVHWKFGFLPIIQLAFVLEHQVELVQSKLLL